MLMNALGKLNGLKIIVPPPIEVRTRRTWKERLFTRPWCPLVTHNVSWKETIEGDQVLKTRDSLMMNQTTYNLLKAAWERDNGGGSGWIG